MAKPLGSYRLSEEAMAIIKQLAARDDRSDAYIVNKAVLLLGEKEGITPDKPAPAKKAKK